MDHWDYWSREEAQQDSSDSNQAVNSDEYLRRQLLLHQLRQNLENSQDQSHYYRNEASAEPVVTNNYQYHVRPDERNYQLGSDERLNNHGQFQQYPQVPQQHHLPLGSHLRGSADINAMDVDESVVARQNPWPNHVPPSHEYGMEMASMQAVPDDFQHRLAAHQKRERYEGEGDTEGHMSFYGHDGGDTAPAQKRMKPETNGNAILEMLLGRQSSPSMAPRERPLQGENGEGHPPDKKLPASSGYGNDDTETPSRKGELGHSSSLESGASASQIATNQPREQSENGPSSNLNALIDGLFGEAPSRESFATGIGADEEYQSDTNSNISAVETDGRTEELNIDGGIFDDAEDDIDLPAAFHYATASSASHRTLEAASTSHTVGQSIPTSFRHTADSFYEPNDPRETDIRPCQVDGDAFSDAVDDPTVKAVEAAISGEKVKSSDPKSKKKKQRAKPTLSKPIASPSQKETKVATALLNEATDLTLVLPENACRLLAKEFWIFTVQQFGHVFDRSAAAYDTPSMRALRDEIKDQVARSIVEEDAGESFDGSTRGLEPNGVERLLKVQSLAPSKARLPSDSMEQDRTAPTASSHGEKSGDEAEKKQALENSTENTHYSLDDDTLIASTARPGANVDRSAGDIVMEEGQFDSMTFISNTTRPADASLDVADQSEGMQIDAHPNSVIDSNAPAAKGVSSSMPMSGVTLDTSVLDDKNAIAERILSSWAGRLEEWKRDPSRTEKESLEEMKSSFSLQGPFGLLFPEILHNFLASISVATAYDFLSVKFTEAALAMQALVVWRQLCELESVKAENLARYMGGITSRVKTALSSVPPADAHTRKWMGSSLACLTASSKEFLIDECKLETPEDFLDGRTSDFSEKLVAWRARKQKSVLKGSGRVAMISSFKAVVRDSMAAEDTKNGTGRVTSEDELITLSRKLYPAEDNSGTKLKSEAIKPKQKKHKDLSKLTESQRLKAETVLKSADFLKSVLMPDNVEFLSTQSIFTPEQLLNTDKQAESTLIAALIKWKTEKSGKEALATSCRRLLFDWSSKVKERVKQVAMGLAAKDSSKKAPPKPQARKPDASSSPPKRPRVRYPENLSDPLHALSPTALAFLETIGITTGDKFLSTRTSEMATALVEWRERENKAALKGTGCSATVSGWKAAVRKAKEFMEGRGESIVPNNEHERISTPRPRRSSLPPKLKIDDVTHPYLLYGFPRRKFLVQNSKDPRFVYEFELSVRKPGNDFVVCLTYRGAKEILSAGNGVKEDETTTRADPPIVEDPASLFFPVLQDATGSIHRSRDVTDTFVASRPGCGLIDVGIYGAIPLPRDGEDHPGISTMIENFLQNDYPSVYKCSGERQQWRQDSRASNVLVRVSPEKGTQCLFYAADPIEKGQTLELHFSPRTERPSKDFTAEPFVTIVNRLSLACNMSSLSLADLNGVVEQASKILDSAKDDAARTEIAQDGQKTRTHPQMVRRRIHWLASNVLRSLEESREGSDDTSRRTRKALIEDAKKLLMTDGDCITFHSYSQHSGEEDVLDELSQEILCDAVMNNSLREWLESGSWCKISTDLLKKCLQTASAYLLGSLGGNEPRHDVLEDIEKCVFDSVKRIISWERDLGELAFHAGTGPNDPVSRECFLANYEQLPKGIVAMASAEEAYENAMDLCDEVSFDDSVKQALCGDAEEHKAVIATKVPWNKDSTIMRSLRDVEKENAQIDAKWYIENQILSVAHAIASSRLLQTATTRDAQPDCSYARFATVARRILEADPTDDRRPSLEQPCVSSERLVNVKLFPGVPERSITTNVAVPNTLPLFLAVVWPRLKTVYGFSIEVGDDPDNVTFFPPGHKGQLQLASERQLGMQRLERSRKRFKVQQRVNEVGFGDIPKFTKRMFISASRDDLEHENGTPVKDALKRFVSSVLSELPEGDDAECRRRMTAIEDAVNECFDELAPSILPEDDSGSKGTADLEVAHLMQILLVLPSLLEQSGLPMRKIEDTLGVIRDLAEFMTFKNDELFAEGVQLCREEYESGYDVSRPFLLPRMQQLVSIPSASPSMDSPQGQLTAASDPDFIREIINPEDMQELSGFIGTVLRQFLPSRADELDASKRRGIHVGYPGMMCRHCAGKGTEGRFYFTSLDSLNTAATATLGHVYKCPHIPDDLKKEIANLKTRHGDERRALKHGAQARFFSRLWKRLWSADGIAPPVVLANHRTIGDKEVELTPTEASSSLQNDEAHELEFKSHTDLLNYLDTTAPWSKKADIRERIEQYYACVAYGGDIYDTAAMPKNFSSEWILSQMVPPERLSTKRTFLTG